jgi:hypothetical protein
LRSWIGDELTRLSGDAAPEADPLADDDAPVSCVVFDQQSSLALSVIQGGTPIIDHLQNMSTKQWDAAIQQ